MKKKKQNEKIHFIAFSSGWKQIKNLSLLALEFSISCDKMKTCTTFNGKFEGWEI